MSDKHAPDRDGPAGLWQRRPGQAIGGRRDEVVAVYCEPDREGKPVDPVKEFALEKGLPVHQPANFNDRKRSTRYASINADLMVMAFVNVFVPEAARDTPTHGSICFHPSLLPLHRGPSRRQLAYYHGCDQIRI